MKQEGTLPTQEENALDTALAHLVELLEADAVPEARAWVRELQTRWPNSERVSHWARVLEPPRSWVELGDLETHRETNSMTVVVPEEALAGLDMTPEEAADEILLAAAVKLYELGRLSSGAAAQLAGVPRTVFLCKLADYGVSTFRQTEEELKEELASA